MHAHVWCSLAWLWSVAGFAALVSLGSEWQNGEMSPFAEARVFVVVVVITCKNTGEL